MAANLRAAWLAFASFTLAVAVAVAFAARADEALPAAQYSIKQSEAATGTRIPRRIVQGSAIPMNRTYAQLTDDERQLVKSRYEAMLPLDEPPFPAAGLKPIHEAIAEIHRVLHVEGNLSMLAEIDAQGTATSISVFESPDPRLTQAAAAVLRLTKFKPAVCRGEPCKMSFPLRVSFQVER